MLTVFLLEMHGAVGGMFAFQKWGGGRLEPKPDSLVYFSNLM